MKYSICVPLTAALPPHLAPVPLRRRSRNRQVSDPSSRNATSTRATSAADSVGRSTTSTENDTIPESGGTTASIPSKRGARRSELDERSTSRSPRVNKRWLPSPAASVVSFEKNWPCTSTAEARDPLRVCCDTSDWILAGKATSANGSSGSATELSTIGRAYTGSTVTSAGDSRPVISTPCASGATGNSTFGCSGRRCVTCTPLGPVQYVPSLVGGCWFSAGCER